MKGMKKLFALLAVLTMALTMTPMVAPVAAANELKITLNTTSTTLYESATTQLKVEKVELAVGETTIELPTASVEFSWASFSEKIKNAFDGVYPTISLILFSL